MYLKTDTVHSIYIYDLCYSEESRVNIEKGNKKD
jgi:hypothetical protein